MSRLWAITSYFNPVGYRRRSVNYRIFRERLAVPLATVELSFDGNFALTDFDADILLQLHGKDVMWQKESLLNRILKCLPTECAHVAWIDCDVVFGSDDWVKNTLIALDQFSLLHLFENRINLPREASNEKMSLSHLSKYATTGYPSAIHLLSRGEARDEDFSRSTSQLTGRSTVGLAWATSRKIIQTHGLYDACILGSADRAIVGAALGRFDIGIKALKMSGARKEHYLAWAHPFHEAIEGRIGHIPGTAYHLWHGDWNDRRYENRQDLLNQYNFNPFVDIAQDDQGLWKWASDKPLLHQEICSYFGNRNEDGNTSRPK
jgi:hypothetical protein